MKNSRINELYGTIKRRKQQNEIDYEFKHFIRTESPYLYLKTSCKVHEIMERKRILKIIRNKIRIYRECASTKPRDARKYAYKILAMHELLNALGEERE